MRTNDMLIVGALGLIGWLLYRFLDQRAEAQTLLTRQQNSYPEQVEPWHQLFVPTIPRIQLPLLEPDPVLDTAILVEYDVTGYGL